MQNRYKKRRCCSLIVKTAFLLFTLASVAVAQETRREIVNNAPAPEQDAKPNSDQVPDVYAVSGQFQRILTLRCKYETDLLAAIEKMVKEEKIKNAVILSGIGSVKSYSVHQVSNRTFPSKNTFVTNPTASADLIGMNGYIINGKVHAHVTFATPDKAFGGHLESGTKVFTFAIVTIGVMADSVDFNRLDDKTYR
jgi:predicted DNA-binding protein with PD1-like motif